MRDHTENLSDGPTASGAAPLRAGDLHVGNVHQLHNVPAHIELQKLKTSRVVGEPALKIEFNRELTLTEQLMLDDFIEMMVNNTAIIGSR